jgi:hypothetical protein
MVELFNWETIWEAVKIIYFILILFFLVCINDAIERGFRFLSRDVAGYIQQAKKPGYPLR